MNTGPRNANPLHNTFAKKKNPRAIANKATTRGFGLRCGCYIWAVAAPPALPLALTETETLAETCTAAMALAA